MSEIKARNWYTLTNQEQFTGATLIHKFRNPTDITVGGYSGGVHGYLIWKTTSTSVTIRIGNGNGSSGTLVYNVVVRLT